MALASRGDESSTENWVALRTKNPRIRFIAQWSVLDFLGGSPKAPLPI